MEKAVNLMEKASYIPIYSRSIIFKWENIIMIIKQASYNVNHIRAAYMYIYIYLYNMVARDNVFAAYPGFASGQSRISSEMLKSQKILDPKP